jgi:hypothetical protein
LLLRARILVIGCVLRIDANNPDSTGGFTLKELFWAILAGEPQSVLRAFSTGIHSSSGEQYSFT